MTWFKQVRASSTISTGTVLKEKAVYVTVILRGAENFTASNGWIKKLKECHCVIYKVVLGEQECWSHDSRDVENRNSPK
jgi:hypothetical protein